jgi:IQ calmodulin-binding motif
MVLDDEMEAAAIKIQSKFRGIKTRKDVKKEDEATSSSQTECLEGAEKKIEDGVEKLTISDELEEKKEEEADKAEEDEAAPGDEEPTTSTEKTEKQLQDEEDIGSWIL